MEEIGGLEIQEFASLNPPREATDQLGMRLAQRFPQAVLSPGEVEITEAMVWKLDPRAPMNTVSGENPYMLLQLAVRDKERVSGSVSIDSGQLVLDRGAGANPARTAELLEDQEHIFNFELGGEGRCLILELDLPGETHDWYESPAVGGVISKLREVLAVTGQDVKIAVKTREGKQLATMAEFTIKPEQLLVDGDRVFHTGEFKGFMDRRGELLVGDRHKSHDEIFNSHRLEGGGAVLFTMAGDILEANISEGVPVEVWGPGVAARLMRAGMDKERIIKVKGRMGEYGNIEIGGKLEDLVTGIRPEQVTNFPVVEFFADKSGAPVSMGVGRYIGEVGGSDWLVRGVDIAAREYTLVNEAGETRKIGSGEVGAGLRAGQWEFIGMRKPYKVERELEWKSDRGVVGVVTNDGEVLWSDNAPDHSSLRKTAMLLQSEVAGNAQYYPDAGKWIVSGSREAVGRTLAEMKKAADKNPELVRGKVRIQLTDGSLPEFGEMEYDSLMPLWERFFGAGKRESTGTG